MTSEEAAIRKDKLKSGVRFFYDLQKLRIQSGNRTSAGVDTNPLDELDKKFLEKTSDGLEVLEKDALKEVLRLLKPIPIYAWLKAQKGVGPTMAGVLVSEIDITKCNTASQLWAWCGLAVRDGKADRRVRGEKAKFDPWLKSKVVKVLADCLLRANSKPWRDFYDNYKTRKQNQLVDVCTLCEGKGTVKQEVKPKPGQTKKDVKGNGKVLKCANCNATGGPAPWGRSDAHRHQAALRYMVKIFLLELWKQWRALEGLEVRPSYAEEYLHRSHHD